MPAQLTYGTAGATGGGFAGYKGLQPLFREERIDVRPDWTWQRRSAKTWADPYGWSSLWSFGCRLFGGTNGGTDGDSVIMEFGHGYEPFSCDGPGCQFKNRIKGSCVDSSDVAIANATVQAFVTASDAYAGEGVSRDDGTYEVMVEQATSTPHYLVAYKAGSPDIAGTTVNTLLPTAS